MKFGKVFGLILVCVVFVLTTGCSKSPFEKLQAATEGKYFDSREMDGKVFFVPIWNYVGVIQKTIGDPKMTLLSVVGSVSINLGPISVTVDADKIKKVLPQWCIAEFEQRTGKEKRICEQLLALALKKEAGKDEQPIDFVGYFPSKYDVPVIEHAKRIEKLLTAKKLDEAEVEIAKLKKNFRGTDRVSFANWIADSYHAFVLNSQGENKKAKKLIKENMSKKRLNALGSESRAYMHQDYASLFPILGSIGRHTFD